MALKTMRRLMDDIDPPHGLESWERLCAGHEKPQTYTVQTPSGGMHLYFRWPAGGQRRLFSRSHRPPRG